MRRLVRPDLRILLITGGTEYACSLAAAISTRACTSTKPFEIDALAKRVKDLPATPTSQDSALAGAASALTVRRQAAC